MSEIRVTTGKKPRICQGDVFKDIECIEYANEHKGVVEVSKIRFPLVVVLTQDCDLEQNSRYFGRKPKPATQDKKLFSILVAPLYNCAQFTSGDHLSELNLKMQSIAKGTATDKLKQNETPRYHYLEFPEATQIVPSVIDFKHFFTVHVEYLTSQRSKSFVCTIGELYREDLSQRFGAYLARIGLP